MDWPMVVARTTYAFPRSGVARRVCLGLDTNDIVRRKVHFGSLVRCCGDSRIALDLQRCDRIDGNVDRHSRNERRLASPPCDCVAEARSKM